MQNFKTFFISPYSCIKPLYISQFMIRFSGHNLSISVTNTFEADDTNNINSNEYNGNMKWFTRRCHKIRLRSGTKTFFMDSSHTLHSGNTCAWHYVNTLSKLNGSNILTLKPHIPNFSFLELTANLFFVMKLPLVIRQICCLRNISVLMVLWIIDILIYLK